MRGSDVKIQDVKVPNLRYFLAVLPNETLTPYALFAVFGKTSAVKNRLTTYTPTEISVPK